jgi:hypothetical protein
MNLHAVNLLFDAVKPVEGLAIALPSSSTPDYVSLKGYRKCAILIHILNGTTVTGSAITVKQATAVAGTGEKALSFSKAWRNIDCAAADALAEFAVTSDTFTTDSTNSKHLMYLIDVDVEKLDRANGFDCIRAGTGNATATLLFSVVYYLYGARYASSPPPAAITD